MSRSVEQGEAPQHRFPPHILREYAFLGDGHRGALCGPQGDIVWMCAPRWHDDAAFSALLGGPGAYAITPVAPFVWGGHYEPRSLIWRNRWVTTNGIAECRDALRYPAGPDRAVLLRRIEAEHTLRLRVELDVRAGFGAHPMEVLARDDRGSWDARSGPLRIRWSGAPHAYVAADGVLRTELTVPAGERHDLVLEVTSGSDPGDPVDPARAWSTTEQAWHEAVPAQPGLIGRRDAEQAIAVLRGMTVPGSGMAAAATTSLPERAERGRNYDYRYSWIRDQCYAGIASAAVGHESLLRDALSFVTARVLDSRDSLRPVYTVDGGEIPGERSLDLPGYPGGQKVVRGNRAGRQYQLDTFGEILQLLATGAQHGLLDRDGWQAARIAAGVVEVRWTKPEAGIWELNDDWWTHSRLACVAGLRAISGCAPSPERARRLGALADEILDETTRSCLHPSGYWQRSPGRTGVDAALVLPPLRGAVGRNDPRTEATLDAVVDQLTRDNYVYRFHPDAGELGEEEGAFLMCGFVLARAELQQGREQASARRFERNRAACGPPGLYAEEYDVEQRQLRGNYPQAFVHAMLLETAAALSR